MNNLRWGRLLLLELGFLLPYGLLVWAFLTVPPIVWVQSLIVIAGLGLLACNIWLFLIIVAVMNFG